MAKYAKVCLREFNTEVSVAITDEDKPPVPESVIESWQRIVNLIATLTGVPTALVMRIQEENIEVFLKSANIENPYQSGALEKLGKGLYCETVIGRDSELIISNALSNTSWRDNPDVKYDMISYYGIPIKWPDGQFFGTICVLDNTSNRYNETYKDLLREFKQSMEKDLDFLVKNVQLKLLAERDLLTMIYNRGKIESLLENEFKRCRRYGQRMVVILMDLNKFKHINDNYGHNTGDAMLRCLASSVQSRIRTTDMFGRWGGDEFLLICPGIEAKGAFSLLASLQETVPQEMQDIVANAGFSHGIALYQTDDIRHQDLVKRADRELYKAKKQLP